MQETPREKFFEVQVASRLSRETKEKFRRLTEKAGQDMSNVIREMIESYVEDLECS